MRQSGPVLTTETHHGFVCANSGVDQSSSGAHGRLVLLPKDPDASARQLRAGLAALGVFRPGSGIGILAGMSAQAIGRNPDAAGQIRGIAIILAAFAEGLGVLAIVGGLLAIFITG